jgi:hypothetical protein
VRSEPIQTSGLTIAVTCTFSLPRKRHRFATGFARGRP